MVNLDNKHLRNFRINCDRNKSERVKNHIWVIIIIVVK